MKIMYGNCYNIFFVYAPVCDIILRMFALLHINRQLHDVMMKCNALTTLLVHDLFLANMGFKYYYNIHFVIF
jgi:hypothetical protein